MSDLNYKTASELASLIQKRDVSAVELVDAYLEQIAAHNRDRLPSVSWAVTLAAAEQAYEDAAALLGASRAAPVARTG